MILTQRSGEKVTEAIKAEIGDLVLAIFNIQLHVIKDASERQRVPSSHPMEGRRSFMLILEDSSVREVG